MFLDRFSKHPLYKWVVLAAVCLSGTFCIGYLNGTSAFLAIYYADRFNDRKIAGVIGTVQTAIQTLGGMVHIHSVCIYLISCTQTYWCRYILYIASDCDQIPIHFRSFIFLQSIHSTGHMHIIFMICNYMYVSKPRFLLNILVPPISLFRWWV